MADYRKSHFEMCCRSVTKVRINRRVVYEEAERLNLFWI